MFSFRYFALVSLIFVIDFFIFYWFIFWEQNKKEHVSIHHHFHFCSLYHIMSEGQKLMLG